ncbi:Sarcolemmal membrane-associated protein-like protein [Dinothrombium tinctorium]|uniref:Sarcolemmal membrane-associated protein n=1 Tax=Dinothrombium tinctorium TaxID=1965070 RepID=A0A3S4RM73_9ACAR|nr:Sarcolemmal membrane-associated protein-like protein [Dinothrombium tinctorium]RWS17909.1 Sarcolemmal membrane-associated protein-like protein [Dinothrombium tinctorium]RWS18016.1 Sarcolemmal membrane-associated protein-like protein [Dinothrombium tinctorium]
MLPKACLICRPNSHPFQERKLIVDNQVKIGRAVARSKPSPDNAIFDCKVLSRNHALLWYEDGKFFLQDTRSSNGTFINNQRLSPANEESSPKELSSGDVVQFGVDVVENTKKVTHGCIIATVKLYHPDGTEAKVSHDYSIYGSSCLFSTGSGGGHPATFSSQNLYLLAQYLKEALHREEVLKNKLANLQSLITTTQEISESSWKSMVEEDRLISKIESLQHRIESLLNANSVNDADEKVALLEKELMKLHDEKEKFEEAAKESIQKSLEEKLNAFSRIYELESALKMAEDECTRLNDLCTLGENELSALAEKQDKLNQELDEMRRKAREAEDKITSLTDNLKQEKNKYENKITELQLQETELRELVDHLKEKNESAFVQIERLRQQLEVSKMEICSKQEQGTNENFTYPSSHNCNTSVKSETVNTKTKNLELQLVNCVSICENDNSLILEQNNSLTNGEISNERYQKETQSPNVDNDTNNTSQLLSELEALKKLLNEARITKQLLEDKVFNLEKELKELAASKEELKIEAEANASKLLLVKSDFEEKNKLHESSLHQISSLKQELLTIQRNYDLLNSQLIELRNTSNHQLNSNSNFNSVLKLKNQVQNDLRFLEGESKDYESVITEEFDAADRRKYVNETFAALPSSNNVSLTSDQSKSKSLLEEDSHQANRHEERMQACSSVQTKLMDEKDFRFWKQKHDALIREVKEKQLKLEAIQKEISHLKEENEQCLKVQKQLSEELQNVKEEYDLINYQNKTVRKYCNNKNTEKQIEFQASACAIVPLLILLLALIFAYYPSISVVTGTLES